MTPWELLIASVLYVSVSWRYVDNGDPGLALAFLAYALANIGFIWAAKT